jgi:NAD(P)-dependent dehydrogenase (short-subunit alcohol dehydrogenase family)
MHANVVKDLDQKSRDAHRDYHMLGIGRVDDIGAIATFLMSDAARWITGASLAVDGGYTAQ